MTMEPQSKLESVKSRANFVFGPCPNSVRIRPKSACHADHFVARHVLGEMRPRATRVLDVATMHGHHPPTSPAPVACSSLHAKASTRAPSTPSSTPTFNLPRLELPLIYLGACTANTAMASPRQLKLLPLLLLPEPATSLALPWLAAARSGQAFHSRSR